MSHDLTSGDGLTNIIKKKKSNGFYTALICNIDHRIQKY
jgi:hypothetical protein